MRSHFTWLHLFLSAKTWSTGNMQSCQAVTIQKNHTLLSAYTRLEAGKSQIGSALGRNVKNHSCYCKLKFWDIYFERRILNCIYYVYSYFDIIFGKAHLPFFRIGPLSKSANLQQKLSHQTLLCQEELLRNFAMCLVFIYMSI